RKKGEGFRIPVSQFAATIQTFGGYLAGDNKANAELRLEGKKGKVLNVGAKNAFAEFGDVAEADVGEQVSVCLGLTELASVMGFLKDRVESVVVTPVGKVAHVQAGSFEFLFSLRPGK
ncbi:MAG: hypothetical protein Q8P12_07305, partial [bacterium]|nr:hypothetical protein [bacterium]